MESILDLLARDTEPKALSTPYWEDESSYSAAATREKVRWYQTILKVAGGHPGLDVNGNHNDPSTRNAMKAFQRSQGLQATGYLTVATNAAVNQVALEWMFNEKIPNKVGQMGTALRDKIRELQAYYRIGVDGKTGFQTRTVMVKVLTGVLPIPNVHPQLGRGIAVGTDILTRPTAEAVDQLRTDLHLANSGPNAKLDPLSSGIIGPTDDRDRIKDTSMAPFRWICSIIAFVPHRTKSNQFLALPPATGTLISPWHILTAGHVLTQDPFDDGSFAFETTHAIVTIGQNVDDPPIAGPLTAHIFRIPDLYRYLSLDHYDYGLIKLPEAIDSKRVGHWRRNGRFHKIKPIDRQAMEGKKVYLCGYPEDKSARYGLTQWIARGHVMTKHLLDRGHLYQSEKGRKLIAYSCDSYSGMSGGPVWHVTFKKGRSVRRMVAINSKTLGGDVARDIPRVSLGTALTKTVVDEIKGWMWSM